MATIDTLLDTERLIRYEPEASSDEMAWRELYLTSEGRSLADRVQEPLEELDRSILSELNDRDVRAFGRVLEAIARVTGVEVRSKEE